MRTSTILLFATANLGLFGGAARADQILIGFTAAVNRVSDANHHLTTAITPGDTITGTVTYSIKDFAAQKNIRKGARL